MNLSALVIWLARSLALLGGVVLVAVTVVTTVSVLGRAIVTMAYMDVADGAFGMTWLRLAAAWLVSIGARPIPGDFELVEAGTGFAIFAFLPWCQLNRGHASVDLFTSAMSPTVNRVINLVSEILMTGIVGLIAWRLWYGLADKHRYGETTFILQYPLWWAYAICMVAAAVGVLVSISMVGTRIMELRGGTTLPDLQPGQGSGH